MALQRITTVKEKREPCNKKSFNTKRGAGNALGSIKNELDGRKKPQRFYLCENCNRYHLTSQPNRKYNE